MRRPPELIEGAEELNGLGSAAAAVNAGTIGLRLAADGTVEMYMQPHHDPDRGPRDGAWLHVSKQNCYEVLRAQRHAATQAAFGPHPSDLIIQGAEPWRTADPRYYQFVASVAKAYASRSSDGACHFSTADGLGSVHVGAGGDDHFVSQVLYQLRGRYKAGQTQAITEKLVAHYRQHPGNNSAGADLGNRL